MTRYYYRIIEGRPEAGTAAAVSMTGTFRTAPPASERVHVRFTYSGDSDARFQPFTVLGAVQREAPEFFAYLGDTIYADTASAAGNVTQVPPAETLPVSRAKYRKNRQLVRDPACVVDVPHKRALKCLQNGKWDQYSDACRMVWFPNDTPL